MQKSKNNITSQVQKATIYDSTQLAGQKKIKGFKIILVTCHTEQKFFRYCVFFGKNKNNCGEDFEEEGEEYVMEREKLQERRSNLRHFFWSALSNDFTTIYTSLGTHINNMISRFINI